MQEKRILPPTVWQYDEPCGDEGQMVPYALYDEVMRNRHVGDELTFYAGAPGTGSITHRITRMDETGVYGVVVSNTIRELTPAEVR